MNYRIITPVSVEPVTLAEAKLHLRVDIADDDALISGFISAAREWAENLTAQSWAEQTLEMAVDGFSHQLCLLQGPVSEIVSVVYEDIDGNDQIASAALYRLGMDQYGNNVLTLKAGMSWPAASGMPGSVRVRYKAGPVPVNSPPEYVGFPESVKSAIKLQLGDLYEHRESSFVGVSHVQNPTALNLLHFYRRRIGI